jgi:hypothetical protein
MTALSSVRARVEAGAREFSRAEVRVLLAEIERLERANAGLLIRFEHERALVSDLAGKLAKVRRIAQRLAQSLAQADRNH